jgi:hypothetical protein
MMSIFGPSSAKEGFGNNKTKTETEKIIKKKSKKYFFNVELIALY